MSRYRLSITIALTVVAFALSYQSTPFVKQRDSDNQFSACKVAGDIKIISAEPHSIEHPEARAKMRDYLAKRLNQMQVSSICYSYDSVPSRLKIPIKITNLYAKIDPFNGEASGYLLLVAHLDSRFKTKVLDKEVYSFGAADDGYGLGVILESVRLAMGYRKSWRQGIKILFTDSEESDLEGMKYALSENPEIFENIGLVINVEARGVKGPALLFETSKGNENIIELYKSAKYPVAYSLTSAVYNFLPNSTDYSLLKDSFPGMNFSVIDNINYYHTDLDNFNNISLSSIQHYGEQITPVINKYLTNLTYSNSTSLISEKESLFFTVPLFGLIVFSRSGFWIFNILILLLFIGVSLLLLKKKKIGVKGVLKNVAIISIYALVSSLAGFCIALLCAAVTKQKYNLINLPYVGHEWLIIGALFILFSSLYSISYLRGIRKMRFNPLESIIGNTSIQIIISIALYLFLGENFFVLIPVFLAISASLLGVITKSGSFFIVAYFLIILLLLPFYYALAVSLTIGSLPIIMALSTLFVSLLIPLNDCFNRKLA
ncbi:MAG: M28 family peptidase [Bacteroidales bacterium]